MRATFNPFSGNLTMIEDSLIQDGDRDLILWTNKGGTDTDTLVLDLPSTVSPAFDGEDVWYINATDGFVWNTNQETLSARFATPNASHLLFLDGDNNALGMNTDDPTFSRNGSTKATVFGALKNDVDGSNVGFYALASNTKTRAADLSLLKCTGTWASKGQLAINDVIGNIGWEGYDANNTFQRSAIIRGTVDDTTSSGRVPVELLFITGDSTDTYTPLRLTSVGLVRFGGGRSTPEIEFDSETGAAEFNVQENDADFIVNGNGLSGLFQTDAGNGTVKTGGGRIRNTTEIDHTDSPYTVLSTDHEITADTDGGAITLLLPAGVVGTNLRIINVGSSGNDVTVTPNGTEQIANSGSGVSVTLSDTDILILTYFASHNWW